MFRHAFREFDEDPFFSAGFRNVHDEIGRMFEDHYNMFGQPALRGIEDRPRREERSLERPREEGRMREVAPRRDIFGDMFSSMNAMMENMQRGFADMERKMVDASSDPNCYSYSHSMVSSYRNDGQGDPKYYQAAKSTSKAPGGIKQTTKEVRDSETGEHKMAVGHHIGDKGHVIERRANRKTNKKEEHQNYVGMDENEYDAFQNEWKEKTGNLFGHGRTLEDHGYRDRDRQDRAVRDRPGRPHRHQRPVEEHRPHAAHGGKRPPRNAIEFKATEENQREHKHDKTRKGSEHREFKHDRSKTKKRDY